MAGASSGRGVQRAFRRPHGDIAGPVFPRRVPGAAQRGDSPRLIALFLNRRPQRRCLFKQDLGRCVHYFAGEVMETVLPSPADPERFMSASMRRITSLASCGKASKSTRPANDSGNSVPRKDFTISLNFPCTPDFMAAFPDRLACSQLKMAKAACQPLQISGVLPALVSPKLPWRLARCQCAWSGKFDTNAFDIKLPYNSTNGEL
jgi:hypothetical protein